MLNNIEQSIDETNYKSTQLDLNLILSVKPKSIRKNVFIENKLLNFNTPYTDTSQKRIARKTIT